MDQYWYVVQWGCCFFLVCCCCFLFVGESFEVGLIDYGVGSIEFCYVGCQGCVDLYYVMWIEMGMWIVCCMYIVMGVIEYDWDIQMFDLVGGFEIFWLIGLNG